MVIARILNRGGLPACSHARRQGVSMCLTAKRQATGKVLAVNRRNGPRSRGPVTPRSRAHSGAGQGPVVQEWPTKRTAREFRGGSETKKNFTSKTTKCMKTLGERTKCHDKRANIRRKSGLLFGQLRPREVEFARNCTFRRAISSDHGLRKTVRRAEGCRAAGQGRKGYKSEALPFLRSSLRLRALAKYVIFRHQKRGPQICRYIWRCV